MSYSNTMIVLIAATMVFAVVHAQTATPLSGTPNTTPNNLGSATQGPTNSAADCGQVEFDIFNIGSTGQPSQDLFQYTTFNGGAGVNFAGTYIVSLPSPIFNGGVDLEIILTSLQGEYASVTTVTGLTPAIDTIVVTLNNQYSLMQNYNPLGNNFTFNSTNTPFVGNTNSIVLNNFSVAINQLFATQNGLTTNSTCFVSYILEVNNPQISGDPQFTGLRGQTYQIHGIDGAVYNLITDEQYQLNSRFAFLTGPRPCPIIPSTGKKSSACWSHPGSYISEIGLTYNGQRVSIVAGPASTGFTSVTVNGKPVKVGYATAIAAYNTTFEVTLIFGEWTIEVENSDMFVNLRSVRVAPSAWSSLNSHGLLGQTWSSKRHSGKVTAIEGEVDDYVVAEDDLFGKNFIFNKLE